MEGMGFETHKLVLGSSISILPMAMKFISLEQKKTDIMETHNMHKKMESDTQYIK